MYNFFSSSTNILFKYFVWFPAQGGVLTVYMMGCLAELHTVNPKKYMSLKFYIKISYPKK